MCYHIEILIIESVFLTLLLSVWFWACFVSDLRATCGSVSSALFHPMVSLLASSAIWCNGVGRHLRKPGCEKQSPLFQLFVQLVSKLLLGSCSWPFIRFILAVRTAFQKMSRHFGIFRARKQTDRHSCSHLRRWWPKEGHRTPRNQKKQNFKKWKI